MGNVRKRKNVRLIISAKDYKKYVSKPSFVSHTKKKYLVKSLLLFMRLNQSEHLKNQYMYDLVF